MEKPTLNPEEMILELRYSGGSADQGRVPIAVRIRALEALQRAQRQMVEHQLGVEPRPGPPSATVTEASQLDSMPAAPGSLVERVAPAVTVGMTGIVAFNSVADGLTGAVAPPERVGESLQDLLEPLNGAQTLTIAKRWDDAAPIRTYRPGDFVVGFDPAGQRTNDPIKPSYVGRLSAVDLRKRRGTLIKAGSKPLNFEFERDLDGQFANLVWRWIRISCTASPSANDRPIAVDVDALPEYDDGAFWHPSKVDQLIRERGIKPYEPTGSSRHLTDEDLDELLPGSSLK